jgi:hypothetical protein
VGVFRFLRADPQRCRTAALQESHGQPEAARGLDRLLEAPVKGRVQEQVAPVDDAIAIIVAVVHTSFGCIRVHVAVVVVAVIGLDPPITVAIRNGGRVIGL